MGFAVNVPHYLAHLDYPAAALKLLDCVAAAAGLELPTEALDFAAATVSRTEVDAQVAASEQVASVVHALEAQYDEIVAGRGRGPGRRRRPAADRGRDGRGVRAIPFPAGRSRHRRGQRRPGRPLTVRRTPGRPCGCDRSPV